VIGALWTNITGAFRRTALPLAAYYAITLAVPLANGAARSGAAFVAHAVVVLVVPPAMILLASALRYCSRSAIKGFAVPARQAGRKAARVPTASKAVAAATNAMGSSALTP
jgi:hypothetical protein